MVGNCHDPYLEYQIAHFLFLPLPPDDLLWLAGAPEDGGSTFELP